MQLTPKKSTQICCGYKKYFGDKEKYDTLDVVLIVFD